MTDWQKVLYGEQAKAAKYQGAIEYAGTQIAQWHNPRLFMDDIITENKFKQFTSILLIGSPGTGKSTLRRFIAHEVHTREDFVVCNFDKYDLENFDKLIDELPNRNLFLSFEDVSKAFSTMKDPKKKDRILQVITEARHPKFASSDRRIIILSEIHYLHATEKMLRSLGNWKFWTEMSTEELGNFNHITGNRFGYKAAAFQKIALDQFRKGNFEMSLTNNTTYRYTTNKPFRVVMCYDSVRPRFFLVPNKYCKLCDGSYKGTLQARATPAEIIDLAQQYYGNDGIGGLKAALLNTGRSEQYRNNFVYGYEAGREILAGFDVDLEALAMALRRKAKITGQPRYGRRSKTKNLLADLEEIRKQKTKNTQETK